MGFFHPGAWCWAGLAVVVALLYLWNFARGRHEVATYWLWQRALARRPAWFRLRFWLSLATQLVILLLLVAALAEPYWKAAVAGRRTLVLILDVSASMSATDVKPSRFAAAQAEARRIVQGLQPGERMAILSVGSLVRIVCPLTGEPVILKVAIDAAVPTDGATRMQEAVDLARRMLDGQSNPRIVLLTDGCFPQAEDVAKDGHVYLKRFGEGGRNLAITRLAVRFDPKDPKQQAVLVETANNSDSAGECRLSVAMDGGKPRTTAVTLAAGGVAQTTLPVPVETSGVLTARLDGANDDLTVDDQARVWVTRRPRPTVFFVPAGHDTPEAAIRAALETVPAIDLQVVDRLPDKLPPQTVAVFHRQVPQRLPPCPVFAIAPQGPCDLWQVAGTIRETACGVKDVRRDSPLLAGVRFEDVVVEEAVKLQFKEPAASLVEANSGDPLVSLIERRAGPVLVLHVDLQKDKSDFALRRDFRRCIAQAVWWLNGTTDRSSAAADCQTLVAVVPDAKIDTILSRNGRSLDVGSGVSLLGLEHVGEWEVPAVPAEEEPSTRDQEPRTADEQRSVPWLTGGGKERPLPVSVVSREESNIRAGAKVASRDVDSPAPVREQPLWMLLAGVAGVLLLLEWCLFHRRVVV